MVTMDTEPLSSDRFVEIGYVPVHSKSSLAFPPPRVLLSQRLQPLSRRAVQSCPAVNTFENRTIEILAPFSIRLRCVQSDRGKFDVHVIAEGTRLDLPLVRQFVTVMPREIWRSEEAPVIQVGLPHFFVSDVECFLTQTPAWASESKNVIPGKIISGRFPTHIWPRTLNLAFEWSEQSEDLVLKRGDPCCYLLVEGPNPNLPVRLFPAAMTEELKEYRSRMEDVVKFTSGSFKLFEEAEKVRPSKLVSEIKNEYLRG